MSRKFEYRMDKAGVVAILKSGAVRAELAKEAERKAAQANAACSRHYPKGATGSDYVAEVRDLTYTSVGVVFPETPLAKKDRNVHRTLDAINH